MILEGLRFINPFVPKFDLERWKSSWQVQQ